MVMVGTTVVLSWLAIFSGGYLLYPCLLYHISISTIYYLLPAAGIVYGVWRGVQHCDCARASYYPVRRPVRRGYIKMSQKHLISSR